ncbi:MAG: TMEM43 family protein [Rudaea sp.]|nr:TMEM43 family protein [Rudaea sp.]
MARRKKSSTRRIALWIVVIALVVVAAGVGLQRMHAPYVPVVNPINAEHSDTTEPGRRVTIAGKLEIRQPPSDAQFGIAADAAILLREVSMYQWRERCLGGNCRYDNAWSGLPVDSRKFHVPEGHENPPLPFADARFNAGEIHLGGLTVAPELAAAHLAAVSYPVHADALPPNLAATFREVDGNLYAGGDPARPKIGELRVSYRIVPTGAATLSGVQRGAKLTEN